MTVPHARSTCCTLPFSHAHNLHAQEVRPCLCLDIQYTLSFLTLTVARQLTHKTQYAYTRIKTHSPIINKVFSPTHTHISILSHIHTQTIINPCICENILVCVRIFSPKHTDKYFLPHTHIQVVSPPQTHTHTHTHTLTHTRIRAERQGLGLRMLHVCSIRRQIKTDFVFHIKGRHALGFSPSLPSSSPPPLLPPSLPLSLTLPHRFMNK